jgi:hypothetical protein
VGEQVRSLGLRLPQPEPEDHLYSFNSALIKRFFTHFSLASPRQRPGQLDYRLTVKEYQPKEHRGVITESYEGGDKETSHADHLPPACGIPRLEELIALRAWACQHRALALFMCSRAAFIAAFSSLQYSQPGSEQYGSPTSSGGSSDAFAKNGLIGHAAMLPPLTKRSSEHNESAQRLIGSFESSDARRTALPQDRSVKN